MLTINIIATAAFGVLAGVHAFMAYIGREQKIVSNTISLLLAIFLTGWSVLLLVLDLEITPTLFTTYIVIFIIGSMYQVLVYMNKPAPGVAVTGSLMAVAGFFLFTAATTTELSLFALVAAIFTQVGAAALVVLFGHAANPLAIFTPVVFALGASAIAVGFYMSAIGSTLTVFISLLILGGLVVVQGVTGILTHWSCDFKNIRKVTVYELISLDDKRAKHHDKKKKSDDEIF